MTRIFKYFLRVFHVNPCPIFIQELEFFILDIKSIKSLIASGERVGYLDTKTANSFLFQNKEISIVTDPDQPVWADGEYTGRTPISMRVMPGVFKVVVLAHANNG